MAKKNKNEKPGKKGLGNAAKGIVRRGTEDIRYGKSVSLDFFKRNAWMLLAILTALISVMGLRYRTKTRMAEIKQLTIDLDRAESAKLHEKANYMTLIRETEMTRLTARKRLGLQYQEEPPVEIECETTGNQQQGN